MHTIFTKKSKSLLSLLLIFAFLISSFAFPSSSAYAADKASLSDETYYMGTGSDCRDMNFYSGSKYCLTLINPVQEATYSYESSDTNIVTVKAKDTTIYLTGVKPGTATITCTQTLKGETTTVGKCKVIVSGASLRDMGEILCIGKKITWSTYDSLCQIDNRNTAAKYTYKTDSKNLVMDEVKVDMSQSYMKGSYIYCQRYTAKKAGTYKVTVSEKLGKSTKEIGTFNVTVMKPQYTKKYTLDTGSTFDLSTFIQNPLNATIESYYIEGVGFKLNSKSIISTAKNEDGTLYYIARKAGTAKVTLYQGTKKSHKKVCDLTIKIQDTGCEDIELDVSEHIFLEDGKVKMSVAKYPELAVDDLKVISTNEDLATIEYNKDENCYYLTPVNIGIVTIVATCGKITKTVNVTIINNEE